MGILEHLNGQLSLQEHQFNVQGQYVAKFNAALRRINRYSKHAVNDPEAHKLLASESISVTLTPESEHAHAADKTIAEYINVEVLPPMMRHSDFDLVSHRGFKAQLLATLTQRNVRVQNPIISVKDVVRYSEDPAALTHMGVTLSPFEHERALIIDAAHHFSPADVENLFVHSPNLLDLFVTLVIPPELLDGLKPMYPSIYTFERVPSRNTFKYYPSGHVAGQYEQSMDCLWWLKTNYIKGDHYTLKLEIVYSCFAHHICVVTRRDVVPPSTASFRMPNRVQVPREIIPYLSTKFYSVNRKIYETAMNYVCSVNKANLNQIFARVRMTGNSIKDEYMLSDAFIVTQLAAAMKQHALASLPEQLDVFYPHHLITRVGPLRWLRLLLKAPERQAFEMMMTRMDLEAYNCTQVLQCVYVGSKAPKSAGFTGELPPPTFREHLQLLEHIIMGGKGSTPLPSLLGGEPVKGMELVPYDKPSLVGSFIQNFLARFPAPTQLGPAHFSPFYARCILLSLQLQLPIARAAKLLYALALKPTLRRRILGHIWLTPPTILALYILPIVYRRLHSLALEWLTQFLHKLAIPRFFPKAVQSAYYTLKMGAAPLTLNEAPAQLLNLKFQEGTTATTRPQPLDTVAPEYTEAPPLEQPPSAPNSGPGEAAGPSTPTNELPVCHVKLSHPVDDEHPMGDKCVILRGNHQAIKEGEACAACLHIPDEATPPYPKGLDCLFEAVSEATGVSLQRIWQVYSAGNERAAALSERPAGTSELDAHFLAQRLRIFLRINTTNEGLFECGLIGAPEYTIQYRPGHYFFTKLTGGMAKHTPKPVSQLKLTWFDYTPSASRAGKLQKAIEQKQEGILLPYNPQFLKNSKSVCDFASPDRRLKITVIGGLPGTGKSYEIRKAFQPLTNLDGETFRVVTWESTLRDSIKKDYRAAQGRGYRFCTWEAPLAGNYAPVMILDDVGKFAPGYISLLTLLCPGITHIICTGDPTQETFHSHHPESALNKMLPEIDHLQAFYSEYKLTARRYCCTVAEKLGLPHHCTKAKTGDINFNALPRPGTTIITSTTAAKRTLTEVGRDAYTASGSQGHTSARTYEIHYDRFLAVASDRTWFTALTRAAAGIDIVRSFSANPPPVASRIGRAVLDGNVSELQAAIAAHLRRYIPPKFLDPTKFGATAKLHGGSPEYNPPAAVEQVIEQLPHLSGILDTTPEPQFADPSQIPTDLTFEAEHTPAGVWKSLYDVAEHGRDQLLALVGTLFREVDNKEAREVDYGGERTDQVDDTNELTSLFIRHKRGDTATEKWTLKERYVHPDHRTQQTQASLGALLYQAFDETYRPVFPDFNEALWEECGKYDQDVFLSKGVKRLAAIADRACPEWLINRAEMFMKGQSVTKPGTIGNKAKKGQLIIMFCTELNFRFGRLARYASVTLKEALPDNVFLLDGKTDKDMSTFVRRFFDFSALSAEDDYTGFDSTQGPEFQVADAHLFNAMHIPYEEILFYLKFLTEIETFLGLLGPMMPSGFKFTLLLNTTRSMAYQALKYVIEITRSACMFTGDDVVINPSPPLAPTWSKVEKRFLLVSKRVESTYPTFCGWKLTPPGCFKQPTLLLHRTAYQAARGNLPNCILNYMADITPLNKNLEQFAPYLTADELGDHLANLDILRAEAKTTGIGSFGSFVERYGVTRHYSLHGGGNPITHTRHNQVPSPANTMTYDTIINRKLFNNLQASLWVDVRAWRRIHRVLQKCDYSVIDSRRNAHTELIKFYDETMVLGDTLFGITTRYPSQLCVTDYEVSVAQLIDGLVTVLSHRLTNVAKDVDAARSSGKDKQVAEAILPEQNVQDNTKRFEELRKQMMNVPIWDQAQFETTVGAVWIDPPAAPRT